ncbi:FAD-binding protein [Deinococcus sonorensis]|uniref:FAD-binding protein n=2 Tax=Deinococcus sonorensis TaxID=309891 RepID=A0AAU7U4Z2_9DEIO
MAERNWGGNVTYHARDLHRPRTLEDVQAVVRQATAPRPLGTRHSFNTLPDTPGELISLEHLNRVLALDPQRRTVTIQGGVRYGELGRYLHDHGFALPNLASLPHISVAGACMTGTHGSGDRQPSLAAAVRAMELVTASGDIVRTSREQEGDRFAGMVVSLGALGMVTELTLNIEPTYQVRQDVYEGLRLAEVERHFDEVMSAADSVSLFTTWQDEVFHSAWLKRRSTPDTPVPPVWFGAGRATQEHHPIPGLDAASCTPQLGVAGPWFERLPHFRLSHTPSNGEEVQSEYLLPREHATAALRTLFTLGERLSGLLLVSEVRTVRADDLWLSPAYRRDSVAVHFTWRRDEAAVRRVLHEVEDALAPFEARPHWGKVFVTPPERLQTVYPRLPDFRSLCNDLDPHGRFQNAFLQAVIGVPAADSSAVSSLRR